MMPYFDAVPGFSSTLSLTILTLPLSDLEISSSAGAIIRHGPHHSAQKSTTTGSFALSTSLSNVASVTFSTMGGPRFWQIRRVGPNVWTAPRGVKERPDQDCETEQLPTPSSLHDECTGAAARLASWRGMSAALHPGQYSISSIG